VFGFKGKFATERSQIAAFFAIITAGALYALYAVPGIEFSWWRFLAWTALTLEAGVAAFALVAKTTEDGMLATGAAAATMGAMIGILIVTM